MKEKTKLPLILVLALPVLLIISTELSDISFNIMGHPIYLINFIFPLTFLVSILITKKTESKVATNIVALSLIIQSAVFILKWVLFGNIDYLLMEITFLAFFISHLLLLFGYEILKERELTNKFVWVFLVLLIATITETMFYLILLVNTTLISLIIAVVVKIIYDLIIAKIMT